MGKESGKAAKQVRVRSDRFMDNGRSFSIYVTLQEPKKSKAAAAGKIPKDPVFRGLPSPARGTDGTVRKAGRRLRLRRWERAGVAGRATSVLPLSGPASARDGESAGPGTLPRPPASPLCSPFAPWVWGGGIRPGGGQARAKGRWGVGGTRRLGGRGRGRAERGRGKRVTPRWQQARWHPGPALGDRHGIPLMLGGSRKWHF